MKEPRFCGLKSSSSFLLVIFTLACLLPRLLHSAHGVVELLLAATVRVDLARVAANDDRVETSRRLDEYFRVFFFSRDVLESHHVGITDLIRATRNRKC